MIRYRGISISATKITKHLVNGKPEGEWDFYISFPNSLLTFIYTLNIGNTKDIIYSFVADKYKGYIYRLIYVKENPKCLFIDYGKLQMVIKNTNHEILKAYVKKYVKFNSNSQMLEK